MLLGKLCRTAYFQRQLEQAGWPYRPGVGDYHHPTPSTHNGLLSYLGIIAESNGNLAKPHHWENGLVLARQVGNLARISNLLVNLGMLAVETSDRPATAGYLTGLEVARPTSQEMAGIC